MTQVSQIRKPAAKASMTAVEVPSPKERRVLADARLLVVDDEESVAFTISEVLRREDLVVDTALSGEEAIAALRSKEYDLVLTDLHMGVVDGIAVLSEVRKRSPLTITIVLTGFASLDSAIAAMRQGAYDYLVKPCIIGDMTETIRRGLQHRKLLIAEQQARSNLEQLNLLLEQRVNERTAQLQKVNEELSKANRAKDVFFATLSHELRTPLNAILGWAGLLRSRKLDEAQAVRAVEIIEKNARQQAQLISDILDISSIMTGKLHLDIRPIDLVSVVNTAMDTVGPAAESKQIKLESSFANPVEPLTGDAARLQQVVLNLLSNAIKYTPAKGCVTVKLWRESERVVLQVTDTGYGISPEFLPYVFESFTQADSSLTRARGGLGLGLAIVRQITQLHGGGVQAESGGEGSGASFTVWLPFSVAVPTVGSVTASKIPAPKLDLKGLHILIVDDEQDTLELVSTVLKREGARVTGAHSARGALEAFSRERVDILLSDIAMPEEDGYSLVQRVRALGFDVPAAALTAHAGAEDRARALAAGFQRHLAKPIDPFELLEAVAHLAKQI
ncbi:MAG: response regulator [Acidobacteria bacterium]|nr:response regulator [Acidobacteriota bacterium]